MSPDPWSASPYVGGIDHGGTELIASVELLPILIRLFGYVALGAALYAAYELAFRPWVWRHRIGVIARAWVVVLPGTVGIDEVLFGQNALLAAGYFFTLPLVPLQVAVVVSLLVAMWAWFEL
jgi:hypothetical protein